MMKILTFCTKPMVKLRDNSVTHQLHLSAQDHMTLTSNPKAKKNSELRTTFYVFLPHHCLPSKSSFQKQTKIFITYEEFK